MCPKLGILLRFLCFSPLARSLALLGKCLERVCVCVELVNFRVWPALLLLLLLRLMMMRLVICSFLFRFAPSFSLCSVLFWLFVMLSLSSLFCSMTTISRASFVVLLVVFHCCFHCPEDVLVFLFLRVLFSPFLSFFKTWRLLL